MQGTRITYVPQADVNFEHGHLASDHGQRHEAAQAALAQPVRNLLSMP